MGLSGDHIPLVARIVAVADRFDQLWTMKKDEPEFIWNALMADRGNRLDPVLVDRLIDQQDRVLDLVARFQVGQG